MQDLLLPQYCYSSLACFAEASKPFSLALHLLSQPFLHTAIVKVSCDFPFRQSTSFSPQEVFSLLLVTPPPLLPFPFFGFFLPPLAPSLLETLSRYLLVFPRVLPLRSQPTTKTHPFWFIPCAFASSQSSQTSPSGERVIPPPPSFFFPRGLINSPPLLLLLTIFLYGNTILLLPLSWISKLLCVSLFCRLFYFS